MKRKINLERIAILVLGIAILLSAIVNYNQAKQIKDINKKIEKIGIPIEMKEGYYYDYSDVPQQLLESEVILK